NLKGVLEGLNWLRHLLALRLSFRSTRVGRTPFEDFDGAALRFNLFARGRADGVDLDGQLLGDLTAAQQLHAAALEPGKAFAAERFHVDHVAGLEALVEDVEIDFGHFTPLLGEEAALGQTAMQRHLTAFEAETARVAGPRFLALVALAAGLARAGRGTAADALTP